MRTCSCLGTDAWVIKTQFHQFFLVRELASIISFEILRSNHCLVIQICNGGPGNEWKRHDNNQVLVELEISL